MLYFNRLMSHYSQSEPRFVIKSYLQLLLTPGFLFSLTEVVNRRQEYGLGVRTKSRPMDRFVAHTSIGLGH